MSLYLTAIIKAKPGQAERMKSLLLELTTASREEEACLQYDLHQSTTAAELFIFHEEWADREGFDLHNSQAHIAKFIKASQDIIDGQVLLHQTEKISS
jgi:quinol monooxygenase YgiN